MSLRTTIALGLAAGCATPGDLVDARDAFVIDTLAVDNAEWALREPELVRDKLTKMQRSPFIWLRGTAAVFWRAQNSLGSRAPTAFGSEASSRVLLVGDPHPENLGSFRAADGTFVIDWNDFDGAGYGPYGLDVRRLAVGMIVATARTDAAAAEIARAVGLGYANRIAELAAGTTVAPLGRGAEPYLDKLIDKAQRDGDANKLLDEVAPVGADGTRAIAFGDLDPVAPDGVIEKRYAPVGAEAAVWIASAIAAWSHGTRHVQLECRRIGSGVSSYAALRYVVVLDDDVVVELKEERDGVIVRGVPQLASGPWRTPAARVVAAQHALQARPDEDPLLGFADVGALSLRIHDRAAYQRGTDALDLGALPADQQVALAGRFGALLASAHAGALTSDGVPGLAVIAPLLAGQADAFADEVATTASAEAAVLASDFDRLHTRDLSTLVLPGRQ